MTTTKNTYERIVDEFIRRRERVTSATACLMADAIDHVFEAVTNEQIAEAVDRHLKTRRARRMHGWQQVTIDGNERTICRYCKQDAASVDGDFGCAGRETP